MTIEGFALQAGSYSAEIWRRATMGVLLERGASVGSVKGGLVAATDLQTTAGTGMNIETSVGEVIVDQAYSTSGGPNYMRNTSTLTTKVPAASATNPRVDLLVAQILDAAYHGSSNEYIFPYLEGTPTAGATLANRTTHGQPATPTSAYPLAYILVSANATKVENANIENVATLARLAPARIGPESVTGPQLGSGTLRQATGTPQGFLSWGVISSTGTVLAGTFDYTVHMEGNTYVIEWNKAKATALYAIAAAAGPLGGDTVMSVYHRETARFSLVAWSPKETTVATEFSFYVSATS